jgi:hypothetical protein
MSKIIVKLKNKTKNYSYKEIPNDILISNIRIKTDIVNMDIAYKPNDKPKTYEFMLSDYFGIPMLNNSTDDSGYDVPYQSYIQEVFESLSEIHNFSIQ